MSDKKQRKAFLSSMVLSWSHPHVMLQSCFETLLLSSFIYFPLHLISAFSFFLSVCPLLGLKLNVLSVLFNDDQRQIVNRN